MANLDTELRKKLKTLLKTTALSVTESQQDQLVKLILLLNKWNRAYNLTSVREPKEMLIKHIMDSLVVSPYLQGLRFIDVGTGPGLPGLPLAIINPDKRFVLLDSLGKRISFIRNAVRELGLANVETVLSRVEKYQPEVKFDGILSRAFASLKDMTDWCRHLPVKNGAFYALKGTCHQDEIERLGENFRVAEIIKLNVPELEAERHLIVLKAV